MIFWNFAESKTIRSSRPEGFLGKGVLKIRSKFTGDYPCWSAISIKFNNVFQSFSIKFFFIRTPLDGCFWTIIEHCFKSFFFHGFVNPFFLIWINFYCYKYSSINLRQVCKCHCSITTLTRIVCIWSLTYREIRSSTKKIKLVFRKVTLSITSCYCKIWNIKNTNMKKIKQIMSQWFLIHNP